MLAEVQPTACTRMKPLAFLGAVLKLVTGNSMHIGLARLTTTPLEESTSLYQYIELA